MCKLIAELVGTDKRIVSEMFSRLEKRSGEPGIDIRLTGEIYGKLHMKTRALGLDPTDTMPHELYQAMLNLARLHDSFLIKRLGIEDLDSPTELIESVGRLVGRLHLPKHTWALKHVAARRLLKATPPKQLMKLLNYRSLESMLKREPSDILLVIARHTEPVAWQQKFVHSYKKLQANDFESRDIKIATLTDNHWKAVDLYMKSIGHSNIIYTPEVGTILLLPVHTTHKSGLALATLLFTLHYFNEIRAFSTYCKFHHIRSDFGSLLIEHLMHEKSDHVQLAGQDVHWKVVHRYYGNVDRMSHPEIFEPHVQPEDLTYRKAEAILYHLEPALHFWHDMDYVGLPTSTGPISFSLTDVAMNLVNNLPYEKRVNYHMRDALWNEVYIRYVGQRTFERQILQQLDGQTGLAMPMIPTMDFV